MVEQLGIHVQIHDGMTAIGEFLFPAPAPRRAGAIIRWWEGRRLVYNLAVGAAGLVSVGTATAISALAGLPLLPLPWQPVVIFGTMANLCYLLGPAAEIIIHKIWGSALLPTGPALYRMGLTFSVGLALFPALLVILWLVIRMLLFVF
jgi:hypothetical protein